MDTLAIAFSRSPVPGRTKSRLASAYSAIERAAIHKACLADAVNSCAEAGLEIEIHFTGGLPADFFVSLLGDDPFEAELHRSIARASRFVPQAEGDLGARMSAAFDRALRDHEAVLIVGSDLPGIDGRVLGDAVEALAKADLVIGPARDGGYYLVGLKRPCPRLFENIAWGRADVALRTKEAARRQGLALLELEPRRDIDTPGDVAAFLAEAATEGSLRRGCAWSYLNTITERKQV